MKKWDPIGVPYQPRTSDIIEQEIEEMSRGMQKEMEEKRHSEAKRKAVEKRKNYLETLNPADRENPKRNWAELPRTKVSRVVGQRPLAVPLVTKGQRPLALELCCSQQTSSTSKRTSEALENTLR